MTNEEIYEAYNKFIGQQSILPHCDARILHDSSDCSCCAKPELQAKRRELGIASTGCYPNPGEIPCPADASRPPGDEGDHRKWYGNRPTSVDRDDPSWPEESLGSKVMYFNVLKENNDNQFRI